jgi:putative oxidoreductase
MLRNIVKTKKTGTILLIRLMVGIIFLSEGIQKFLLPHKRGTGLFSEFGFPEPHIVGPLTGSIEMLCGLLIIIGFLTRLASIPLVFLMLIAMATIKVELLQHNGIWEMLHASRVEWAMLLGSIFLMIRGSGKWSVDHQLQIQNRFAYL